MSSYNYFDILPFNPLVEPVPEIKIPFDWDNVAQELHAQCPNSEIRISWMDGSLAIYLYITVEGHGPWVVAQLTENYSVFSVSLWPKRLAKDLIRWYRAYVPLSYPLFISYPDTGFVAELPPDPLPEEIEGIYPFPVADE